MSTKAYITESHHKRSKMAESLRESSTQSAFALNTEVRLAHKQPKLLLFRHASQSLGEGWWAHQDLNLGPADYESAALTN